MAPETERRRRWPRILLVASLALNLLVVGVVAGALFRFDRDFRRDRPPPGSVGIALIRELPREDQRAMRRALRGKWHADQRADNAALVQLLRAEELDLDGLTAIMERQTDGRILGMKNAQSVWLERVGAMTPAARAAYADRIEAALARRGKDKRRRH